MPSLFHKHTDNRRWSHILPASWSACTFSFLSVCAMPDIALAAKTAKDHASDGNEGLPQLDVSSYPGQVFWLFIFFIALYFIFAKYILPAISATIQNRAAHIQEDQETAAKLTEEAEEAHRLYDEKLAQAKGEAVQVHKDMEAKIYEISQKRWAEFREEARQEEAKIQESINQSRQEALEEMNTIAAEIAQLAAQKITGAHMELDAAKSAVVSLRQKGRAA